MTKLELAFAEAAKLPPAEQEVLAAVILEEIASEARWKRAFAESAEALAALADEALEAHQAGKSLPLDPDKL